jgi:hypothetical protein
VNEPVAGLPARIIQLVARFRPDVDGVGEAALNLADALHRQHGIRSDFLVYNQPGRGPVVGVPESFPFGLKRVAGRGSCALNSALDGIAASASAAPVLLLHYVPYGFSSQGTPTWLPGSLERFTERGGRLITLFHELYALPRLFSRTLFSSWLQRRIFRKVLAASEFAFTSSENFLALIQKQSPQIRSAHLIGICSNVGEPEHPRPLGERKRRLAVFGRFVTRKILYANHLDSLEQIVRHLGIEEVADIGPVEEPDWLEEHVARRFGSLLKSYGTLGVPAVSRLLEDSVAGALAYPYFLRGKSGIFAAYQAHALAILLFPVPGVADSREPGSWTLSVDELLAIPAQSFELQHRLQQAASAGGEHYRQYRSAHAMAETVLPALRAVGAVAREQTGSRP